MAVQMGSLQGAVLAPSAIEAAMEGSAAQPAIQQGLT
jgi:hypothetical protein